jgi:hypothetical protein
MSGRYKIKIRIRSTSDRVSTQTRQSCAGRGKGIKGLCVTGTVLNDLRCQAVGEAQQRGRCRRSDSPSHISHCPVCPDGLVAFPSVLPLFITTSLYRPFAATCFSGESGRIPGHPRLPLTAVSSGRSSAPSRVSQQPSFGRGPRVLRVPYPPHAVVVALDATLSPRACRGMLLDSYGGCRPPQRRVSPPYVLSASPVNHPPADLMPTRPAPHTHSLRMASSASLQTTSSPSPPT